MKWANLFGIDPDYAKPVDDDEVLAGILRRLIVNWDTHMHDGEQRLCVDGSTDLTDAEARVVRALMDEAP